MKRIITPKCECLNCRYRIDSASNMDNDIPVEGDITICIKCQHIMAFDKKLRVRPLTDQEVIDIAGDRDILRYQKAIGHVRSEIKKKEEKQQTRQQRRLEERRARKNRA